MTTDNIVDRKVYLIASSGPYFKPLDSSDSFLDFEDAIEDHIPFEAENPEDWDDNSPDGIMEFAGRTCYDAYGRKRPETAANRDYLANILDQRHGSVLEHSSFTFLLKNISRSATHEIVRHRHMSFCLSGDTKVYLDRPNRAGEKGPSQTRTLAQLYDMWQDRRRTYVKTMTIRSVSPEGHVIHQYVKNVFQTGEKEVYEVVMENGYSVKTTKDHLFMTDARKNLFSRLGDLEVGSEVLVNGRKAELDDRWIIDKVEQGLSTPQIAELADCSTSFIKKRRRALGIPAKLGSGTVGFTPWNKGKPGYNLPKWSEEDKESFKERLKGHPHWTSDYDKWKNGHAVSNKKFSHLREEGCRMCGVQEGRIELDHIDSDPMNNEESNIQPLCAPCHHAKTSGTPPMKVYKSKIASIEYVGKEMTYDLEMDGYHNFVANGVVVHNSQESQRFVHGRNRNIVLPPAVDELSFNEIKVIESAFESNEEMYISLKARGFSHKEASEAARMFLPNSAATSLVITGNARSWKEFIEKRGAEGADAELQGISQDVLEILELVSPGVFSKEQRKKWDGEEIQKNVK